MVSKFLSKFSSTGSIENSDFTWRRKKLTSEADRRLFRMVRTNRRQTLNETLNDLTFRHDDQIDTPLSVRTMTRRLFDEGFKCRRPSKTTTMSKTNWKKRM